MREIILGDLTQCYSRHGVPDHWDRSTQVWLIDLHESYLKSTVSPFDNDMLGLPEKIIEEACNLSQHWTGWGFYTQKTQHGVYSNVPVLLFSEKEDAVMARLRWAGSPFLHTHD